MKRCFFYFQTFLLSLITISTISSFAQAETISGTATLHGYATEESLNRDPYDFDGAYVDLYTTLESGQILNVQVKKNEFRNGRYFQIFPLPADGYGALPRKTGCAEHVDYELTGRFISFIDDREDEGFVKLTRVSIAPNDWDWTINAEVEYRYEREHDRVDNNRVVFLPGSFGRCPGDFIPLGDGLREPHPAISDFVPDLTGTIPGDGHDTPGVGTDEPPPAAPDPAGSDVPSTPPGSSGVSTTPDTSPDVLTPVPTVNGSFFQGTAGCQMGSVPVSAQTFSGLWLLGLVAAFALRRSKK